MGFPADPAAVAKPYAECLELLAVEFGDGPARVSVQSKSVIITGSCAAWTRVHHFSTSVTTDRLGVTLILNTSMATSGLPKIRCR